MASSHTASRLKATANTPLLSRANILLSKATTRLLRASILRNKRHTDSRRLSREAIISSLRQASIPRNKRRTDSRRLSSTERLLHTHHSPTELPPASTALLLPSKEDIMVLPLPRRMERLQRRPRRLRRLHWAMAHRKSSSGMAPQMPRLCALP